MSDIVSKLAEAERELEEADSANGAAAFRNITYIRKGMNVQRFHTTNLIVGETVGHHSANVAMLCMQILPECRAELIAAALVHDLAEQYTGDVPAQAKWASAALKAALDGMEDEYQRFSYDLTPRELRVLKQADMLDLCFKCLDELYMGNRTVLPMLHRGIHYLRHNNPFTVTSYLIKEIQHECQ
jgi:5'-deoxynucleotidase YfbR-like HD superfamily hydrolase